MRAIVCAIVVAVGLTAQPALAQADRTAAVWRSVQAACNAAAAKPPTESAKRIAQTATDEFTRFGGHRIDANGRLFRFGLTEAEHEEEFADAPQARHDRLGWWQVMKYWYALFGEETAGKLEVRGYGDASTPREDAHVATLLRTTAARLLRLADEVSDPDEREILREAALRAAIIDTSWSAAFISYVIKQSGAAAHGFRFANAHSVYIYDAFATSLAELAKESGEGLYRACPVSTTRPRVGDLICNQREPALADAGEETVRERIRADLSGGTAVRSVRRTHCEVVAYVDVGARKTYTVGGNVNQAVAARKLNLRRNLTLSAAQTGRCGGKGHWSLPSSAAHPPQASTLAPSCSLNDRKWFVLLQVR
jgi:hypothetical protein